MTQQEAWEMFKAICPELPYNWDFLERIADSNIEHRLPKQWIGDRLQEELQIYIN